MNPEIIAVAAFCVISLLIFLIMYIIYWRELEKTNDKYIKIYNIVEVSGWTNKYLPNDALEEIRKITHE